MLGLHNTRRSIVVQSSAQGFGMQIADLKWQRENDRWLLLWGNRQAGAVVPVEDGRWCAKCYAGTSFRAASYHSDLERAKTTLASPIEALVISYLSPAALEAIATQGELAEHPMIAAHWQDDPHGTSVLHLGETPFAEVRQAPGHAAFSCNVLASGSPSRKQFSNQLDAQTYSEHAVERLVLDMLNPIARAALLFARIR